MTVTPNHSPQRTRPSRAGGNYHVSWAQSLSVERVRLSLAVLSTVMIVGCSRAPSLRARVQTAGGEAALKPACQSIVEELQKTQKEFWTPQDPALPPAIAAFQPQVVQATKYGCIPMVDIQVSGGFSHHGLLVVLTNTPPEFMPSMGMWKVTKISNGLFEYRE